MIFGGAQERNMRAGTENVYGIIGLAKAMELCYDNLESGLQRITEVREYMIDELKKHIPDVAFNGDVDGRCLYTGAECLLSDE
jgi:cysteine desulfurase